jgi:hypothetical protein
MYIRYALRMLARTPGFTCMAVATLALGIGVNTVVFTLYNAVALKPLAVRAPGEIVRLQWRTDVGQSDQFSWPRWVRQQSGQAEFTVIGVAKTVRSTYLSKEDSGFVYMPRTLHDSPLRC